MPCYGSLPEFCCDGHAVTMNYVPPSLWPFLTAKREYGYGKAAQMIYDQIFFFFNNRYIFHGYKSYSTLLCFRVRAI